MNISVHPNAEVLNGYALVPRADEYNEVRQHVLECSVCRREVREITESLELLKSTGLVSVLPVDTVHITDEQLLAYVNHKLPPTEYQSVQQHLDTCGHCMKELLLYRSFAGNDIKESAIDAQPSPLFRGKGTASGFIEKLKEHFTYWVAIPAVATVVLTIIIAYLVIDGKAEMGQEHQIASQTRFDRPDMVVEGQPGSARQQVEPVPPDNPVQLVNGNQTNRPGVQKVSDGAAGINWYGGYIETTAVGTVDMDRMKNKVHAEMTAEFTARMIAYSQLAEILGGVRVYKKVALKDLLLADNRLSFENRAFIKGAQVIDKHIEWQDQVPKATVTLRAPLYGAHGIDGIIRRTIPAHKYLDADIPRFSLSAGSRMESTVYVYSGIIFDAKGAGFMPTLQPRIITSNAENMFTSIDSVTGKTKVSASVRYFATMEHARASKYYGDNPLIIKTEAKGVTLEPGTIIVRQQDAIKLARHQVLQSERQNMAYAIVY